ncbi:MAG: hypothetical protein ASARMPREDX12_002194 [Alectoria sarmentosa]|nr:MAG: hypothetical protein ASARMPREDX12_002194 [Alectoria sarmentosa]
MNARDHSSEGLLDPIEEEEEEGEEHEEDRDHQDAEDPQSPLFSRRLSEQDRNETFRPDTPPQTPPISPQPVLYRDPAHKMLGLHVNGSAGGTPTKLPAQSPEQITPTRVESAESSTGFPGFLGFPRFQRRPSDQSISRRSDSFMGSTHSSYGLSNIMNLAYRASPGKNAFIATGESLYAGCTYRNIIKGFLWSLAITSMHYVGIAALRIPQGDFTLEPPLVILSGLISWAVCLVGCILMSQIETHLTQQFLFAAVACTGVAAMHFTGMRAAKFWSNEGPSSKRGYPPALAVAIGSIAITTCIAANFLLAHVATISRNKLAEIVITRKKLWRTIAQKENAEAAAAARSDFIASASHEIRTPLHHLQGYSDLLSRTELTEEGRILLYAIQHATKTLSLITNNVLDWSKLEKDGEAVCRPVALDMRTVCESILMLLPNKDDEADANLMVVVSPDVPDSLFLDETYIQRILMNLLSNAIKFTRSGYIILLIEMENGKLVATVKDTGSGIPPSFLPELFEPFKQATTRGSQRGTGLGMSIIKQLLHKMHGTIEVESRHPDTASVEPGQTGSTFTITIPAPLSSAPKREPFFVDAVPSIAVFHGDNERSFEGLRSAWETFGFDVVRVKEFPDLSDSEWKYVWADLLFLKRNPRCLQQLLEQDQWQVLVPYDTQEALQQIPSVQPGPHLVCLQTPLLWHTFTDRIAAAGEPSNNAASARTVRFAPQVDIVDGYDKGQPQEATAKDSVILLINQKLGKKMLTALRYQVLLADNGEEAIEQMIKHDTTIDAILMDQSMPVKDGITATREIRAMEAAGTLSRRRPIIAVTAVVSAQAQALFKAAGAEDFLNKPLSLSKLEQTLAIYLPQQ